MRKTLCFLSAASLRRLVHVLAAVGMIPTVADAGPYSTTGISANDSSFVEWASSCTVTRGYMNIADPSKGYASFGADSVGIGKADTDVVSLGDAGSAILTFKHPITNGAGNDFAVFENAMTSGSNRFCELAFVEVSSDGVNYFRFPSVSLTQTTTQIASYGLLDPSNLYDLAGKDLAGYGTGFDLSELAGVSNLLDVNNVQYVKVIDVVGDIDPAYASYDSLGNIINDPWPTAFPSGGFDLDAVGVIHSVPEPGCLAMLVPAAAAGFILYQRRRRIRRARSCDK